MIASSTTGRVAGIFVESVQGYGGIVEMPKGYMSGAAERVRAAGGLYVADEVQSGFGRTGDHMWGFEADGVVPDIVVMAKGIGNGFPLGAVVAKKEIGDVMADKFMFHTYGANPDELCRRPRGAEGHPRGAGRRRMRESVGGALLAAAEGPAAAPRVDRRCARPRPDAGHRDGEGPQDEGARRRHHRRGLRELPRTGTHPVEVRAAPFGAAHGAAHVPLAWTTSTAWPMASTGPSRR